ncbi:FMRFamide receptor-like [Lineus longissimus]|uniref:FMRFamide receptor-like n=1 Tax=Lineus longissimus TaxID=88925 RepID=UPI00315D9F9E
MESVTNIADLYTDEGKLECVYKTYDLETLRDWVYFLGDGVLSTIVSSFGLPLNILICIVLAYERPYTSTSVLLQALAVVDSMVLLMSMVTSSLPSLIEYTSLYITFYEFKELSYRYLRTLLTASKTASVCIIVCVSLERFIAVCKPLRAAAICTKRNACIACISVFAVTLVYASPDVLQAEMIYPFDPCLGRKVPKMTRSDLMLNYYYVLIYVVSLHIIITSLLPFVILSFVTYSIITSLRKATKAHLSGKNTVQRHKDIKSGTKRVMAVVVVFFILETPGALMQILGALVTFTDVREYITIPVYYIALNITYFFSKLNSAVNFFIYCATGRRFMMTLRHMFACSSD